MYYTLVIIACKCMHLFHCLCYCVNGPEAHCHIVGWLCLRSWSRVSTNQKIGGLIPGCSNLKPWARYWLFLNTWVCKSVLENSCTFFPNKKNFNVSFNSGLLVKISIVHLIYPQIYSRLYIDTLKLNETIQVWSSSLMSVKRICSGTN